MALYSNEFIVIQIDLTGVILVETDIWSLPADKRGNIWMLAAAVLQCARKTDLALESCGIFSILSIFQGYRGEMARV